MRACRRHPRELAGWSCAACRAELCADCVAQQPGGPRGTQIPVCCACGRGVAVLTVHRRAAQRFGSRLGRAFGFPLGSTGIIALAFVGFVRALTSYAGATSMAGAGSFALRQGLYWAFVFFIIRQVADGQRRMGVFDFSDIHADLVAPAGKGVFATAILWLPAVVYVYLVADDGLSGILTYPFYRDPNVWLLALLGALYAPMALIAAATDLGFGHLLNPIFIFQSIYRMGRDYLLAVLAIAGVLLVGGGLAALLGAALAALPVPFVGRWISAAVGLYPPFVAAGIMGLLLHVHGEVLDWGRAEDYATPLLPGVAPRGQLRPKPEPAPAAPARPALAVPSAVGVPELLIEPLALSPHLARRSDGPAAEPDGAPAAPGPDPIALPSLLDLAIPIPPALEPPAAAAPAGQAEPSLRRYEIRVPSAFLEAQAVAVAAEPSPVTPPEAAAPLPTATRPRGASGAPVTAIVEPRPGALDISAAPTVHGFAVSLPPESAAAPTVVGREVVLPPEPPKGSRK